MENLSHSHHHHQNMVSEKTMYNNGATATKALYDDIFGGPPRFGTTALSPRVEDYNEIFAGFHAPSRASSIPVLDLPVVHDDEEEVFFDVRSSLGFDYGEVFGGGPDFALSFQELIMMESNGACHESQASSDDAWMPADAEFLSEESDHSASNQCLSNGDSHESINGNMEFNISYHKASQSTNEDMINGVTGVTQLRAVPGYSFMVDNFTSLPKTDPPLEETDDGHLDIDFTGEMLTERHPRKTVSNPSNSSASGSLCRSDVSSSRGCVRNDTFPNESFITISDLSLRTQPSQLPPPSRPPPPLDVKMRDSGISTPNCGSASSEEKLGESSPPYFDVEVDASSSAAASAAAIKEAMEKAQAELKSAKELMDRKRDGFHSHIKSSSKNGRKSRDVVVTKDAHVYSRTKEEKVQDYYQGEDDNEFSIADERLNFANSKLSAPDSSEGEENVNMATKSSEVNYRKESFSSQDSDKAKGGGEWKYATQFFELVQMDESRTVFDSLNNCIVERGQKEKKSTKVKAVRADYGLDEYPKKSEEAFVWEENNGSSEVAEVTHRQKRVEKVQFAQEICGREESDKKLRINNHAAEYGKRQTKVEDVLQQGSMSEVQQSESTCGVKQTMKYKEKEQKRKANKSLEDQRSEMRHEEHFEQKEDEKKLEAVSVYAQNERQVKEEQKENDKRRDEREKKQKGARKREENERRLREALECEENERKLKHTREKELTDRRLKDTLSKEENERRQTEVLEQEENSKREKEAHEREENEKRLKEASEKENERRVREASERQENERKNREALEMEENEKRIHGNLKQEKIERQKEADEREENEKRHRDSLQKEQKDERIIGEPETEGSGKQLRGVYEEEENGEPHEGDGSDTELTETSELEGVGDMSHKACNMEQTPLRHPDYHEGEELDGMSIVKENYTLFSATCVLDDEKNLRPSRLAGVCQGNGEKQEATEENACGQVETEQTDLRENEKGTAFESANVQIYGKTGESNTVARGCFDHLQSECLKENTRETTCAYESMEKVAEAGLGIGHNNIDKIRVVAAMEYDTGNQEKKLAGGERGKVIMRSQSAFHQEGDRVKMMSNGIVRESIDSATKVDSVQPAVLQLNGSNQRTTQQVHESQSIERKVKTLKFNHSLEEKEVEKVKKQNLLEMERLRKMEEEREREREREKDRMAVDRAALEAHERAYSESREKAQRAAVERATAEARQRSLHEARERLEKACAEAREKSLYDKPSIEARLRAERAAVERATAEARERAFEKAMADRAACEARVRIERSVSEKFSTSSWNGGMKPSASSSELQDQQSQDAGSFTDSRYPYSAVSGSYHAERSEEVEGDSAQRCKARLERHQRTAERAAKALAEKNMRDLLAQREQAERNRLAETLDPDVKRWSSGKEGNLRALLSTLQYILGPDSGWHPVPLTEVITSAAVKRAYRKATLCVHPDKLQQRSATTQQKYVCEKVFDLLKEAWNKFNSEER